MGNKQVTGRPGKHGAGGFADAPADGQGAASQVQSVDRALTILDILAQHGELGVTEMAASLGVHKSTAFRLVSALETPPAGGTAERARQGTGSASASSGWPAPRPPRMNLAEESRPFCRQLAAEFNETVNVAVLDTDAAVNIAQEQGQATVSVQNWIGKRTPAPCHLERKGPARLDRRPAAPRIPPGVAGPVYPAHHHQRRGLADRTRTGSANWAGRVPKKSWRSG